MLFFVKQLLVKIVTKSKMNYSIFKMWSTFIFDLLYLKKDSFYIFSNQSWHYGWDYENRKIIYRSIFTENSSCINIDLNNKWMINILLIYLRFIKRGITKPGDLMDQNNIKNECFCRNFWDVHKNNNKIIPLNTSSKYKLLYEKWCEINLKKFQKMYRKGDKIFSQNGFNGLIVSQFGYEDWAWASLCLMHSKKVFSPEANFGFTSLSMEIELAEANFIRKSSNKLNYGMLKNGIFSLESRCDGKFKNSVLNYYMNDFKPINNLIKSNFDCEFILYLHAYGDSPNNAISDYLGSFGIDYFDSTLKILEEFISRKKHLAIKLHPLSSQYTYDNWCNRIIDEIVNNSKYLHYSENFPLRLLNKYYPKAKIITGRGSIISEASYLGINSFSFCKSVYSEMGMSTLISKIDDLFDFNNINQFSSRELKSKAILLESVKLTSFNASIFSLSNYTKTSVRINANDSIKDFLVSDRIVNL